MKYLKYILIGILFVFLLSVLFLYANKEIVMASTYEDLDSDGEDEWIILTKKIIGRYGKELIIYKGDEEIYRSNISDLKPWKVIGGDIDGDNIPEISIGVYTKTYYHPVMAKRPFIYNYYNGTMQPKWRGSRLSKPLIDYIFFDLDGDGTDEIISIETDEDGGNIINSYKWNGFGIEGYIQGSRQESINGLLVEGNSIYMKLKDGSKIQLDDNLEGKGNEK